MKPKSKYKLFQSNTNYNLQTLRNCWTVTMSYLQSTLVQSGCLYLRKLRILKYQVLYHQPPLQSTLHVSFLIGIVFVETITTAGHNVLWGLRYFQGFGYTYILILQKKLFPKLKTILITRFRGVFYLYCIYKSSCLNGQTILVDILQELCFDGREPSKKSHVYLAPSQHQLALVHRWSS